MGNDYISLGYNFLQLSINAIEEMNRQGNQTLIFSDSSLSDSDTWKEYDEKTKWADQNIAIPILFNFYHGIELILKGLIINCGGNLERKTHKLSSLCKALKETPDRPSQELLTHFNEIISGKGFGLFFTQNKGSVDSFYELFKYPEMTKGKKVDFRELRGQEEAGLIHFNEVKRLALATKQHIIQWKMSL